MPNRKFPAFLDFQSEYKNSKVVIQSIPFEKTTSYIRGTSRAPFEILLASREVELYDEELDFHTHNIGIHTLNPMRCAGDKRRTFERITSETEKLIIDKKFVVSLGGEHTITPFIVRAFANYYKKLSVLVIDAHADLRREYQNSPYSHACASNLTRNFAPVTLVGVRALSIEESLLIKKEKIPVFYDHQIQKDKNWISKVLSTLKENVYISIDFDGLDPSVMPAVGTPVPGGINWWQLLELLKSVGRSRRIVGLDFVELCPSIKAPYAVFTAAKLVYRAIGYATNKKL